MIEILTLLQGLLMRPAELHMQVPTGTTHVEVRLDDRFVVGHAGPPWRFRVPFPENPRPARLQITAFDADGQSTGLEERWINYDLAACTHPAVESDLDSTPFLIEITPGVAEPSAADLAGSFEVDGEPVEVLAVEQGPAEVLVVQDSAMQTLFDRLSAAYIKAKAGRDVASSSQLELGRRMLRDAVRPLEQAPVTEPTAGEEAARTEGTRQRRRRVALENGLTSWRQLGGFAVDGRIRFIWPSGPPVAQLEQQTEVFPLLGPFDADAAGVLWHLHQAARFKDQQRLADAVAIAGFQAAATCRRRVVLLFESATARDASLLTADAVLAYLQSIQVPLFVLRDREWSAAAAQREDDAPIGDDPWGLTTALQNGNEPMQVPTTSDILLDFQRRAEHSLERQRVVWLAGRHLPHEVRFRPPVAGYTASPPPNAGSLPSAASEEMIR